MEAFYERYIANCTLLSVDIKTAGRLVSCVGFAPRTDVALVIPFYDSRTKNRSYWPDECSESKAWAFVTRVLSSPIPKLFQNGLYDILHLKSGLCAGRIRVKDKRYKNPKYDFLLIPGPI